MFEKSHKKSHFWYFIELLSTQTGNLARFAGNVECDFFGRFSNTVTTILIIEIELSKENRVSSRAKKFGSIDFLWHFYVRESIRLTTTLFEGYSGKKAKKGDPCRRT